MFWNIGADKIKHHKSKYWMRDKTADFRVGQNRFWKRDKIADFDNETKPPILKWDKIADS